MDGTEVTVNAKNTSSGLTYRGSGSIGQDGTIDEVFLPKGQSHLERYLTGKLPDIVIPETHFDNDSGHVRLQRE